ncbi:MAG: SPOR domain-containing protein [Bacteroidales bacterium]|nr:SPOR domain-containing protein [Bacteroidales bacterium]
MKKAIIIILTLFAAAPLAFAQNDVIPAVDSTYAAAAAVDSTLAGKDIFNLLGNDAASYVREGTVVIDQSPAMAGAMRQHISSNANKKMTGYRVRIFFDNRQTARSMSERVAGGFKAQHPGIGVYREYENPYFKVTVGDFRTKNDARRFLNSIKGAYPSGFIVKERINYPIM